MPVAVLACLVALLCLPAPAGAELRAGAAIRSVHPNEAVGPAGSTVGQVPATTNVIDALETRAVAIVEGDRAAVFVATDVFGQFAAVEQGPDLGLSAIREAAARRVSEQGSVRLRAQDIVIASSHSHATGSVMGWWGPPPVAFMKLLRDRQIEAIAEAVRRARPAKLEFGRADGARINALTVAQVNAYEGWIPDGLVTALRATDARTGATIATYATIPAHPVLMPGVAFEPDVLSADYPGRVRAELDRILGGVSVVAPGTLGRQTTPWSTAGPDTLARSLRQLEWFSEEAARIVVAALGDARPLRGGIATAETTAETIVTNGVVLSMTALDDAFGERYGTASAGEAPYPLNRDDSPPWQDGARLRTPLTAVRVGDVLYLSQPGEPFTEIRLALRDVITSAREVVAVSQAQDALGYYFPASSAALTLAYSPNDHALFNVAPTFGDAIIARDVQLARRLGFEARDPATAQIPLGHAYERAATSGIQFLASPHMGAACGGTFSPDLQAVYSPVAHQAHVAGGPRPAGGVVRWDFGDGTTAESGYLFRAARGTRAVPEGESIIRHAFRPGRYAVTVSAHDEAGGEPSFTSTVLVLPELRAVISARRSRSSVRLRVKARGGAGKLLRASWTLPGGRRVEGATVRTRRHGVLAVEIADASGTVARTRARLTPAGLRTLEATCEARRRP